MLVIYICTTVGIPFMAAPQDPASRFLQCSLHNHYLHLYSHQVQGLFAFWGPR